MHVYIVLHLQRKYNYKRSYEKRIITVTPR
jgi:hypothetical protein